MLSDVPRRERYQVHGQCLKKATLWNNSRGWYLLRALLPQLVTMCTEQGKLLSTPLSPASGSLRAHPMPMALEPPPPTPSLALQPTHQPPGLTMGVSVPWALGLVRKELGTEVFLLEDPTSHIWEKAPALKGLGRVSHSIQGPLTVAPSQPPSTVSPWPLQSQ